MPTYGINPPALLPPEFPCRVVDGNGSDIEGCVRIDTDSGLCERVVRDALGRLVFDETEGEAQTVWENRPLPITFIPKGTGR